MIPILLIFFVATTLGELADYHDPMINDGLFEGDIMGIDPNIDRNALPKDSQRWPGGIIPYEIDEPLNYVYDKIMDAMKHIQDRTCIRFVQRSDQKDYVKMIKGDGCWSFWGRLGIGAQQLSLGHGCENKGIFVHELLHAIGFEHEHVRSDRDDYMIINWSNIQEDQKHNFRKLLPQENRLLTSFDYDSIMLYGSTAFSTSRTIKNHGIERWQKFVRSL